MKKGDVISVAVFGKRIDSLSSHFIADFEQCQYRIINCDKDENISDLIIKENPNVFLSFGEWSDYENLANAPFEVRCRWLNYDHDTDLEVIGQQVLNCYISDTLNSPRPEDPLVSLITPSYNIGTRIFKTYESLLNQTHKNWEWILFDDSDDDGETYRLLSKVAATDSRIKLFKPHNRSGRIGDVKKNAFSLGRGEFLCELDHDDVLSDKCL